MSAPRVFASPAFLKALEKDLYGLFRSIETEEKDERTGAVVREKVKDVGPLALFREAREGDEVSMRTVHPVTARELKLTKV